MTTIRSSGSPTPWPQRLLVERRSASPKADAQRVLDRLDDEQGDLAIALQWLGQALDGVPVTARTGPAVGTLRAYMRDLGDVKASADGALEAAKLSLGHAPISPLLSHDAPLVMYMTGLYEWCEHLLGTFEELARGLRRDEPIWPVFQYRAINRSFARFDDLTSEIHDALQRLRAAQPGHEETLRALDHRIEEMFWAASWLHLSLTRRFGG
jgi:hypothetical protein